MYIKARSKKGIRRTYKSYGVDAQVQQLFQKTLKDDPRTNSEYIYFKLRVANDREYTQTYFSAPRIWGGGRKDYGKIAIATEVSKMLEKQKPKGVTITEYIHYLITL
jgi:hypothetical protein